MSLLGCFETSIVLCCWTRRRNWIAFIRTSQRAENVFLIFDPNLVQQGEPRGWAQVNHRLSHRKGRPPRTENGRVGRQFCRIWQLARCGISGLEKARRRNVCSILLDLEIWGQVWDWVEDVFTSIGGIPQRSQGVCWRLLRDAKLGGWWIQRWSNQDSEQSWRLELWVGANSNIIGNLYISTFNVFHKEDIIIRMSSSGPRTSPGQRQVFLLLCSQVISTEPTSCPKIFVDMQIRNIDV